MFVEKCQSNKESKKEYFKLYIDYGYMLLPISFDISLISQICDVPLSSLYNLELNKPVKVAELTLKGE